MQLLEPVVENWPTGHAEQADTLDALVDAENVPAGQGIATDASGQKNPAGQLPQDAEPFAANVPAGHATHTAALEADACGDAVPGGHGVLVSGVGQ